MLTQIIASRRLLAKFFFSLAGLLAILVTNLLVAWHIGPEAYGQYGFIVAAATFITQVVIVTLPETYVFYVSANKYSLKETNTAYLLLMLAVSLICILIFTASVFTSSIRAFLWPNIDQLSYLVIGFSYVLLQNGQQSLTRYGDCSQQYDRVEVCRLISRIAALVFVLAGWAAGYLNLMTYLNALIFSLLLFFFLFTERLSFPLGIQDKKSFKQVLSEMYQGWKPISFYTFFNALYTYGGRFGIQITAGALQQGFYTYALFLAMLPIAVLTPMITVYMSHMSKLYSQHSHEILVQRYLFVSKIAILLYGTFSFFVITNASQIMTLLSGQLYEGAIRPLQWLAVFSFLNLFDLLGGNLYFCTERTRLYRLIYNVTCFIGIAAILVLSLAQDLSALNLSIVVTVVIALQVSMHLYGNIRFFKLNVISLFSSFGLTLSMVTGMGLFVNAFVSNLYGRTLLYTFFAALFLWIIYARHPEIKPSSLRFTEN